MYLSVSLCGTWCVKVRLCVPTDMLKGLIFLTFSLKKQFLFVPFELKAINDLIKIDTISDTSRNLYLGV